MKNMEHRKIPIATPNDTWKWFKVKLQPCFLHYVKWACYAATVGNAKNMILSVSTTEHADGTTNVPNAAGVIDWDQLISSVNTSGAHNIKTTMELKIGNYEITEPTDIWIGTYQDSGSADTYGALYLKYTRERLQEVL